MEKKSCSNGLFRSEKRRQTSWRFKKSFCFAENYSSSSLLSLDYSEGRNEFALFFVRSTAPSFWACDEKKSGEKGKKQWWIHLIPSYLEAKSFFLFDIYICTNVKATRDRVVWDELLEWRRSDVHPQENLHLWVNRERIRVRKEAKERDGGVL